MNTVRKKNTHRGSLLFRNIYNKTTEWSERTIDLRTYWSQCVCVWPWKIFKVYWTVGHSFFSCECVNFSLFDRSKQKAPLDRFRRNKHTIILWVVHLKEYFYFYFYFYCCCYLIVTCQEDRMMGHVKC